MGSWTAAKTTCAVRISHSGWERPGLHVQRASNLHMGASCERARCHDP